MDEDLGEDGAGSGSLRERVVVQLARRIHAPVDDVRGRDWVGIADDVLATLGSVLDADRAYVFEVVERGPDEVIVAQRGEWVADGIEPQADNDLLLSFPVRGAGLDESFVALSAGADVHVDDVATLPEQAREVLEAQDIRAVAWSPVVVPGQPIRGFIGVDVCSAPRAWTGADRDLLRAVADLLAVRAAWDFQRASIDAADHATIRAVEREVDASSQLRMLDELRRRVVVSLNHQIRTPLAVLRGAAEALSRPELQSDPSMLSRLGLAVGRQVSHLEVMLGELLDLRSGELSTTGPTERVDVSTTVRLALGNIAAATTAVEFVVELEDELVVDGHPRLLLRAVEHLLDNVRRHAPQATAAAVHARRRDDGIVLEVVDDGPGLPAAWRPLLTDAFMVGTDDHDHPAPRLGVGLALVRHVADLHGGRLSLHDAPGGGTHVRLVLPAAR